MPAHAFVSILASSTTAQPLATAAFGYLLVLLGFEPLNHAAHMTTYSACVSCRGCA
jgi:hypothetical protein